MLNKNANCYNIEKNFKCSTVIITFSEHITNFRSDIWQLKCQQRQTNKTKNGKLILCKLFRIIQFFLLFLLRKASLVSKVAATNRNSSAYLLHTSKTFFYVELFFIFSQTFLETPFRHQNKNNVVETISRFVYQLSEKYWVYYVSEHLKYCTQ